MDVILPSIQWCAASRLNAQYLEAMLQACAEFVDSSSMTSIDPTISQIG